MTATEQRTSGISSHQNGRTSPKTVSCIASNVGSITELLFSSSHSGLSSSSNIPSIEIHEESSNEVQTSSPSPPQILIHTTSEQCIALNQQPSMNINQTSVRNLILFLRNNHCFFLLNQGI
jgi:hypothetical protein